MKIIVARAYLDVFAATSARILLLAILISTMPGCKIGPYTRYVASRIEGRITKSGQPVINATVTREIIVGDNHKKIYQTALTDPDGRFCFNEVTTRGYIQSIATWTYHFEIRVGVDGKEITIWRGWKADNSRFGDFEMAKGFFGKSGDILTFTFDVIESKPSSPPHPVLTYKVGEGWPWK